MTGFFLSPVRFTPVIGDYLLPGHQLQITNHESPITARP